MINLKSLIPLVAKAAPLLGAALDGPIGEMVGSLIASKLGVSQDQLQTTISTDPNVGVKLKEIEEEHYETLKNFTSTEDKIVADNTEGARQREEDMVKLTGKYDWVQHFFALFVAGGFIAICFAVQFVNLAEPNLHLLLVLMGVLSTTFKDVCGYYFGGNGK